MNITRPLSDITRSTRRHAAALAAVASAALLCPLNIFSSSFANAPSDTTAIAQSAVALPDSIALPEPVISEPQGDPEAIIRPFATDSDGIVTESADTVAIAVSPEAMQAIDGHEGQRAERVFNPDPTRAVWMSALFPGLGQIYNRRFWKLPIVAGAFMGLGYGTSWNNTMLTDYTRAYNDLLDNDPTTRSYMDFFPPNTDEGSLDKAWLQARFKRGKDFYRRNRDLCIICMVGVYLVAMVDAYVDASLSHFDISPQLSMDISPALIPEGRTTFPGVGLQWAFNF